MPHLPVKLEVLTPGMLILTILTNLCVSIDAALVTLRHHITGVSGGGFGMRTWSWLLDFLISNILNPQTFRN